MKPSCFLYASSRQIIPDMRVSPAHQIKLNSDEKIHLHSSAKDIRSVNFPKEVSLHHYVNRLPSDHFPVMIEVLLTPKP